MALSNIYQSLVSRNVESKFLIPKLNFLTKLTMLVEDGDIKDSMFNVATEPVFIQGDCLPAPE